jgi:hypothetical protein
MNISRLLNFIGLVLHKTQNAKKGLFIQMCVYGNVNSYLEAPLTPLHGTPVVNHFFIAL